MAQKLPGLVEVCPGVRSCLIEYEPRRLPLLDLLDAIKAADAKLLPVRVLAACPAQVKHMAWFCHGCGCPGGFRQAKGFSIGNRRHHADSLSGSRSMFACQQAFTLVPRSSPRPRPTSKMQAARHYA